MPNKVHATDIAEQFARKSIDMARKSHDQEFQALISVWNDLYECYARDEIEWKEWQQFNDTFEIMKEAAFRYRRELGMIRVPGENLHHA